MLEWGTLADVAINPLVNKLEGVTPQVALGICGLTGMTAYLGLLKVGRLEEKKAGSTVVVSGAAGATGYVVGQIAKLKGYRVIGIAGSDDKTAWLKNDLQFDEVINYKTQDVSETLRVLCPNGIDLYFDNVGGSMFDAVIQQLNRFGVIVHCGAISTYNATEVLTGPRVEWLIITKSLRLQGFIVTDMLADWPAAAQVMIKWAAEGKIYNRISESPANGNVEVIAESFIRMLQGDNTGKSVVVL